MEAGSFGRSLVHCVSGIHELASLGIRFIATSQGLDTDESNPACNLLMHILAAVAQFERELIHERVSAGLFPGLVERRLHDRDKKFCADFRDTLAAGGVSCVALPARSPNLNCYAERWVRSVKSECLAKPLRPLLRLGDLNLSSGVDVPRDS